MIDKNGKHVCEHCGQVVEDDVLDLVYAKDGTLQEWCQECTENDAYECEHCGDWHEGEATEVLVDGWRGSHEDWCPACVETHAVTCDHCGQVVEEDCAFEVEGDNGTTEVWCEECKDDHAEYCERCETYHTLLTEVYVGGSYWRGYESEGWCEECVDRDAIQCDCCGDLFSVDSGIISDYSVYSQGYQQLCDGCVDDHYSTCSHCGDLVPLDDAEWDEWDEPYCPDCYEEHGGNVHEYGHTDGTTFWLKSDLKKYGWELGDEYKKTLFLGIELETDQNDDRAALANDIADEYDEEHVECKRDGSLHDNGLEIVSQPMTPEVHLTSGMWERISQIVRDHGGKSHDACTCGLHVHLSRGFFVDHDAVYRLDRLFHRFEGQLVNFSRRTERSMEWCRIGEDDLHDIPDVAERKKVWEDKKKFAGRYEAVNDTNFATVEIRLWRGTLNMETFRATVEMTTGLAIIANTMTDEFADQLTWSMVKVLVRFALEEQGLPHDDLDAYIERRGL